MQQRTRKVLLVIVGVIVAGILAVLILFVIFAGLIATPRQNRNRASNERFQRTGISAPLIDNLPLAQLSPGR